VNIEILYGKEIENHIDSIAALRLSAFKEYPYLYVGNMEYEKNYLKGYIEEKNATLLQAKVNSELVGVFTGTSLIGNSDIVKDAKSIFEKHGLLPAEYYYSGEMIVLTKHRSLQMAKNLFFLQKKIAKDFGYKKLCALVVERENDHPQKPTDYKSLSSLYERAGFKETDIYLNYHWPTIMLDGTVQEMEHKLKFLVLDLRA